MTKQPHDNPAPRVSVYFNDGQVIGHKTTRLSAWIDELGYSSEQLREIFKCWGEGRTYKKAGADGWSAWAVKLCEPGDASLDPWREQYPYGSLAVS